MKPLAIALGIFIGVLGGFYGGFKIGVARAPSAAAVVAASPSPGAGAARAGGGGGFAGGGGGLAAGSQAACPSAGATGRGAVTGTVTAVSGNTITIHDARCNQDVKVTYDSSTAVTKVAPAQASDVTANLNVNAVGQRQADGSLTATSISITPQRGQ